MKNTSPQKRKINQKVSSKIKYLVDKEWKKTGKIGNTKPKTKKDAVRIAVAVAESMENPKSDANMKRKKKDSADN